MYDLTANDGRIKERPTGNKSMLVLSHNLTNQRSDSVGDNISNNLRNKITQANGRVFLYTIRITYLRYQSNVGFIESRNVDFLSALFNFEVMGVTTPKLISSSLFRSWFQQSLSK